jgi:hypothetical protein
MEHARAVAYNPESCVGATDRFLNFVKPCGAAKWNMSVQQGYTTEERWSGEKHGSPTTLRA